MNHLQQLLSKVFEAEGLAEHERAAALAVEALMRVKVLPLVEVERFDRDAKVFHQVGQLGVRVVALRFGLSRAAVYKILTRHRQQLLDSTKKSA